jgi:hypothetical protein
MLRIIKIANQLTKELINNSRHIIAEFKDISALKRYLKEKPLHIYDYIHDFNSFSKKEKLLEKANIDEDVWDNAIEEYDFDELEKLSDEILKVMSDKDKEDFIYHLHKRNSEEAPSWSHMDFESYILPSNEWLVHFSDNADNIKSSGFVYGVDQMDKLGLTTYLGKIEKEFGGYNFAFIADSKYALHAAKIGRYGKHAVMFRAPGVKVYHYGDQEDQIIFYGKDVNPKDIVLILNQYGEWQVQGGHRGYIFKSENFEDVVNWVEKNYAQYRKQIKNASKNEFEINEPYLKEPVIGYKNPTSKQFNSCKEYDQVRALLDGDDFYVWKDAIHMAAARSLGLQGNSNVIQKPPRKPRRLASGTNWRNNT